ncbi:CoA transferase [Acidobacteria bacterium AH-259-L09]|nr:CoA transferase [Acidobacteria bacterium AH-259-L09]
MIHPVAYALILQPIAAFGIALALLRRCRTDSNHGEFVQTSLAQGAQLVQSTFMYNFAGRVWVEPSGQSAVGDHALHRLYRARDGWLFLGATPSQIQAMSKIPALAGLDELALEKGSDSIGIDSKLGRFLERSLRKRNVRYWVRQFVSVGVGAHAVETISQIRRSAIVVRRMGEAIDPGGKSIVVVRQNHPAGGTVDTVAPAYARLTRSPLRLCEPAPRPGSDTREVLQEAGLDRQDIEELLENGCVAQEWSSEYLPG